jgi:hypothetical protein
LCYKVEDNLAVTNGGAKRLLEKSSRGRLGYIPGISKALSIRNSMPACHTNPKGGAEKATRHEFTTS